MAYYNDGPNIDADEPAPDLILQCAHCARHIAYYGDADDTDKARDTFTLGASEEAACECGAFYGEDDVLDVVSDTASDTPDELAALRDEVTRLRNRETHLVGALRSLWNVALRLRVFSNYADHAMNVARAAINGSDYDCYTMDAHDLAVDGVCEAMRYGK